jgi:hypothetical protein
MLEEDAKRASSLLLHVLCGLTNAADGKCDGVPEREGGGCGVGGSREKWRWLSECDEWKFAVETHSTTSRSVLAGRCEWLRWKNEGNSPMLLRNVDGIEGGQAGDGRRREVCCRVVHPRPSSPGVSTLDLHAAEMKLAGATQISNLAANQAHTQLVLAEEVPDRRAAGDAHSRLAAAAAAAGAAAAGPDAYAHADARLPDGAAVASPRPLPSQFHLRRTARRTQAGLLAVTAAVVC